VIALPDVYQLGPNPFRDSRTALDSINLLEDHGSVERVDGGPK